MPLPKFDLTTRKVDLPSSPFPLPRSLFLITCASSLGACLILIVSMFDLGYLSMWFNPCASIVTLIYHAGVLLIARRPRVPDAPSYFSTAIFSAYLLVFAWLVAFILTTTVLASGHVGSYRVADLRGLPANVHSQRLQVFLTLYEMVAVAGMALKGHAIVLKEGSDPPGWRYSGGDSETNVSTGPVMTESTTNVRVDVESLR